MQELLDTIAAWQAEGVSPGRAVVVRTFGSAPRPEGAVLIAAPDGRVAGSVSGGCVEGAAVEEIRRAWRTGRSRVIRYGISDEQAWDVGLACGGTIDVLVEPAIAPEVLAAARARGTAVVTPLPGDSPPPEPVPHAPGEGAPPPARIVLDDAAASGAVADDVARAASDALRRGASRTIQVGGAALFVEAFPVQPRLVIVGATEVARSLVAIAGQLGYEAVVVDARPAFLDADRFAGATLVNAWPDEAFERLALRPSDAVAIVSHDPKFDEPAIADALRRGVRYVGAIGSRRTQADRRARLQEAGLDDATIARLRGPIGLDLGGRTPAETALAIMAEVVAVRYDASGRPMREREAAGVAR